MSELKIEDMAKATMFPMFGGSAGEDYFTAWVTLPSGDSIGVSQYGGEFPNWGCDSWFKPNGYPLWSNGRGARIGKVRAVNPELETALNAAALEAGLEWS